MSHKILVVEDEHRLRRLYKTELEAEGYEVITVNDGRCALKRLRDEPVNLVVFDLTCPDEAGIECLQDLVNANRKIKVLIHTAYPAHKMDFRTWAADAFVTKSSDTDTLKSAVGRLLEVAPN
ncbi:MAG TPA: response regulator [bacterium]